MWNKQKQAHKRIKDLIKYRNDAVAGYKSDGLIGVTIYGKEVQKMAMRFHL